MATKVFRDPLYNYISVDHKWLVELIDCPEVQRLRRIHQLGVSDITYPGASHTRFSHSLGVLHLMQQAHDRVVKICSKEEEESVNIGRSRLLAAAILHDVGHGPFSHLFEPCLGIDHEEWSVKIIQNKNGKIHNILNRVDPTLPDTVAQLIEKDNFQLPQWQKFLLSSQLDVDRLDYLRRDSLFSGAGYGNFNWYHLLNTLELYNDDIVWPEKAKFAIEEYIYARFYMYQNVYLHKTTRGFEKLLEKMWERAKQLWKTDEKKADIVPVISEFWKAKDPTVEQYLALEEFTVLQQIQKWKDHSDNSLSDLANRFLNRNRFAMIEAPTPNNKLADGYEEWEEALKQLISSNGFDSDTYCVRDKLKGKFYQPYFPEKERDVQGTRNAILIKVDDNNPPVEISTLCPRLVPIIKESVDRYRYYVPCELRKAANILRNKMES